MHVRNAIARALPAVLFLLAAGMPCLAQDAAPQFAPLEHGVNDSVNKSNLNVTARIPLAGTNGRGMGLNVALVNNSNMYVPSGGAWASAPAQYNAGWNLSDNVFAAVADLEVPVQCTYWDPDTQGVMYTSTMEHEEFEYVDSNGIASTFFVAPYYDDATPCDYAPVGPQSGSYPVTSSGMYYNPADGTLTLPNGEVKSYFSAEDTNGNILEWYGSWRDSVGRYILYSNGVPTTTYEYTDSNGAQQTVTETLQSYNIKTNFGCPGIAEYSRNSVNLPVSVALPNGTQYKIDYEGTPGYSGYITGRIAKITLPDGGYISYQYTGANDGISCSDGSTVNLTRTVNDGTNTRVWQYTRAVNGSTSTLTETLPVEPYDGSTADQIVDTFYGGELTQEKTYQGSASGGTLLETVDTTWGAGGTPHTRTITLGSMQSEVTTNYDSYGNLLETDETDWGGGAPGPLLRKTVNTYLTGSAYTDLNIMNRLQSTIVYDGSGNVAAQTQYEYDNYTGGITASGAVEHDANYGTDYTTRGNVTAVKRWRKTDGAWLTTRLQYDDAGNVVSSTDPQGSTTNFSYADAWAQGKCAPSGANGAAYVTSVTNALSQVSHATYNSCTGTVGTTKDANGQTSSFSYDMFGRATEKDSPDGGLTTISYDDTARTVTTTVKLNASTNLSSITKYDELGRTTETKITSDPAGDDYTETT
ncbi:MAG TPA: hypothetical protein VN661_00075, partial [Candidatus Acidoferrales bacterium]|nr:hypothetical protein [Candidatus Acidoferrales bacterium]